MNEPPDPWSRLAQRADDPRLAGLFAGCFVALAAWQAGCAPVWDGDIWWILRAGEDCLRERAVPHLNRYSFTAPDHPWVMHEWLYGVAAAALVRAFGLAGLALGRAFAVAVLVAALLRRTSRDARPA
ncbi:MAG: putative rane protein, partial [Myxococcaceae bacterium]|nr:putative rane protein [Myxococcaceae bacterium]